MKIEYNDTDIVVYINNAYLDIINWEDKRELADQVKKIFLRLKKYYNCSLNGFYKVIIYVNEKYGIILNIEKLEDFDFKIDNIDLKIMINLNSTFYIELDNYPVFEEDRAVYQLDDKFYIDIDNLTDKEIIRYLEFGNIIYGDDTDRVSDAVSCFFDK